MYFLFLSSFLTNSERSVELEENGDEKKNHACVNGVFVSTPLPKSTVQVLAPVQHVVLLLFSTRHRTYRGL